MNPEFKNWLKKNKLKVLWINRKKYNYYSILPMIITTIYDPNTFTPMYITRIISIERYEELEKDPSSLKYNESEI